MNGSVGYLALLEARRCWRTLVLIAAVTGLLGGLAISLVAGSQRSSTVVDRFASSEPPYDLVLFGSSVAADNRPELLKLPGVVRADPSAFVAFVARTTDGTPLLVDTMMSDLSVPDPTVRLLSGRVPERSDPSQILVNANFAKQLDLTVGDSVTLATYGLEQMDAVDSGEYSQPTGPSYPFTIAGIVKFPDEIAADKASSPGLTRYDALLAMVQDSWYWAHNSEHLDFGAAYGIQFDELTITAEQLKESIRALFPQGADLLIEPAESRIRRASLASAVDLETAALLALGIGIVLIGLGTAVLLIKAEQRDHQTDVPTLRALGYTRSEVGLVAMVRFLPVAVVAGLIAVVLAVLLSGRYPVGVGHEIELNPGVDVNLLAVCLGVVIVVGSIAGAAFVVGRPGKVRVRAAQSGDATSGWLARVGAPLRAVIGTQLAFGRRNGRLAMGRCGRQHQLFASA